MKIMKLKAGRGWTWVKQGYQLIMRSPLLAVTTALIGAMSMFALFQLPQLGPLLALVLLPLVQAGYMRVCRALEEDEEVELAHLFAGFEKRIVRLAALGGFLILGLLITATVIMVIGGQELGSLFESFNTTSDEQARLGLMLTAGPRVSYSLLAGFALMCVVVLTFQYAPMLVFFNGASPLGALRASLSGSLQNLIPYTVYQIIMQVVAVVLSILPFHTGMLILLPLSFTSLYVSYRNIFPFADEVAALQAAPPDTRI